MDGGPKRGSGGGPARKSEGRAPPRRGAPGDAEETTGSTAAKEAEGLLLEAAEEAEAAGAPAVPPEVLALARPREEPTLLPLDGFCEAWPPEDPVELGRAITGASVFTGASGVTLRPEGGGPAANCVAFAGPCGRVERVRLAEVDSPEAIEHCLRAVFRLPLGARLVVRDADGCAVPLGAGLLWLPPLRDAAGGASVYQVEASSSGEGACIVNFDPSSSSAGTGFSPPSPRPSGGTLDLDARREVLSAALRKPAFTVDGSTVTPGSEGELAVSAPESVQPPPLPHSVEPVKDLDVSVPALEPLSCTAGASDNLTSSLLLQDEFDFWCRLADCAADAPDFASTIRSADDKAGSGGRLFHRSAPFDTSPQHIDAMYDSWAEDDGMLRKDFLRVRLEREHRLCLGAEQLDSALERVCENFRDATALAIGKVPRIVFASLWQRLTLGLVCKQGGISTTPQLRLMEYCERECLQERSLSERSFLFGAHSRAADAQTTALPGSLRSGPRTHWAWVETSSSELLLRMAVKFFLHPLATEDMLSVCREGTTKIDRYRHQYFVSLEVYALDAKAASPDGLDEDLAVARPTRERITRSTISLLATGSPPTRSKPSASRDWLLSVVNCVDKKAGNNPDPLDCFATDQTAATKVLESIRDDLKAHKRQREYQADFLLYSVIDRAASELTPIYNAYGRRLRWLQSRLDAHPTSVPKSYIDEVSKVRHELQELRQWVGQIKGIVHHLECDCGSPADGAADEAPWRFGADAQGHGQSMRVFLRHTTYFLEQAADRFSLLEDLTKTFTADTERYRSDSMNQALFVLTVATAVFLPAQFLAGVYGMNFVGSDGKPGIPELTSDHGYLVFWLICGSLLLGLPALVCLFLRCRGAGCRKPPPRAKEGRAAVAESE